MATDLTALGRRQKCNNMIIFLSAFAPLSLYGHLRQNRTREQLQLIPILRQDAFMHYLSYRYIILCIIYLYIYNALSKLSNHYLSFKASQKGAVISDITIFILTEGGLMSGFFYFLL